MSFENWTIEELIARCTDFDEMTPEMDREEFAALRRKITELKQASNSPVIPGAEQRIADAVELLKQAAPAMLADNSGPDGPLVGRLKSPVIGIDPASGPDRTVEVRYVAPPGYVMVPKEPTKEMIDAGWLHFMGSKNPSSKGTYEAMLAAAPQEVSNEK